MSFFWAICLRPQQLLSTLLCDFLSWGSSLWPVTRHCSRTRWTKAILLRGCREALTLVLHYIASSGCTAAAFYPLLVPLTGSGGWGLVPATYCDMLTKRTGTSRFREIHRKKENVRGGGKRLLHWKAAAAISSSLLLEKSQKVSSTLSDGLTSELTADTLLWLRPPSGVGQIVRAGPTEPQPLLFNNRIPQVQFECHVI